LSKNIRESAKEIAAAKTVEKSGPKFKSINTAKMPKNMPNRSRV